MNELLPVPRHYGSGSFGARIYIYIYILGDRWCAHLAFAFLNIMFMRWSTMGWPILFHWWTMDMLLSCIILQEAVALEDMRTSGATAAPASAFLTLIKDWASVSRASLLPCALMPLLSIIRDVSDPPEYFIPVVMEILMGRLVGTIINHCTILIALFDEIFFGYSIPALCHF